MTFETLTSFDVLRVMQNIPASLYKLLKCENVVLAGGCIRDTVAGLPVKDIDVFCHSEEQARNLAVRLSTFVLHTTFAYSVNDGVPIQFVYYKDFTDAKDLISQFDFRACCAGIYWQPDVSNTGSWVSIAIEGFREDCEARVLRFMSQKKDENKLTALRRALNFALKGWTISDDELASVITHWEPTIDVERVKHSFRPCYGRL
jgi:hypothetical protein